MRPAFIAAIATASILCLPSTFVAQTRPHPVAHTESFDKPIRRTVVDLGRSTNLMPYDKRPVILTCDYYPAFMVKQIDDPGNKGALLLVWTRLKSGQAWPCSKKKRPGEMEFKDQYGYFLGVKHGLIFLDWADGTDGGLPFVIFDSTTGAKIFQDSRRLDKGGITSMRFVHTPDSQITFRYLRVFSGSCSIPVHGEECWAKFKQQTGLTTSPMPVCRNDFEGKDQGDIPSVISYPVETSISPKPATKILGRPVACGPVD